VLRYLARSLSLYFAAVPTLYSVFLSSEIVLSIYLVCSLRASPSSLYFLSKPLSLSISAYNYATRASNPFPPFCASLRSFSAFRRLFLAAASALSSPGIYTFIRSRSPATWPSSMMRDSYSFRRSLNVSFSSLLFFNSSPRR
jgi:hypothetical protein